MQAEGVKAAKIRYKVELITIFIYLYIYIFIYKIYIYIFIYLYIYIFIYLYTRLNIYLWATSADSTNGPSSCPVIIWPGKTTELESFRQGAGLPLQHQHLGTSCWGEVGFWRILGDSSPDGTMDTWTYLICKPWIPGLQRESHPEPGQWITLFPGKGKAIAGTLRPEYGWIVQHLVLSLQQVSVGDQPRQFGGAVSSRGQGGKAERVGLHLQTIWRTESHSAIL